MKALYKVTYTPISDQTPEDIDLTTTPYGTANVIASDVEDAISKIKEEFIGQAIEIDAGFIGDDDEEETHEDEEELICKKVIFHNVEMLSVIDIE